MDTNLLTIKKSQSCAYSAIAICVFTCRDNQRLQGLGQGKIWYCKGGCLPQSHTYSVIAEVTPILCVYYFTKSGI